ncbi:minor capsid protein [Aeribacillus composti]|uniref:minor capsid protein n=1 Tax=Aeribacillus composti TaxID=1868734 RepID=UPI002E1F367D|nr:minor capsid protein [Aeribacillus composti]
MNKFQKELLSIVEEMYKLTDKEFNQIIFQYKNSKDQIKQYLAELFMQYGKDGLLDYFQLNQNGALKEFERKVEQELQKIGALEITVLTAILGTVFAHVYYKTAFKLEQSLEIAIDFKRLNPAIIKEFVDFDWSGQHFSERIWNNQTALKNALKTILVRGMQDGESIDKMARKITKQFESKAYQSKKLVVSETARIIGQARENIYADSGVQKVEWLATLEQNTCEICAKLDGKVFDLDDPKKPKIPRHPNCRCDLIPYISNEKKFRKDNETKQYIPYKTYEEWSKANGI